MNVPSAVVTQQSRSVLVVDDDIVFRTRLARALTDRGLDVQSAASVSEALAVARAGSPELAVVDVRMPGGSGLDALQGLLEIDPTTRVIMLTGFGSIGNAVEAMKRGATDYLSKPANADEILAAFDDMPTTTTDGSAVPSLARVEWEYIQRVLADAGSISEAARRLGLHRQSLQRKLAKRPADR